MAEDCVREILFRGKREDNGKWVYGNLLQHPNGQCFVLVEIGGFKVFSVIPFTVGQYTGLCDKNGNKIFEGDVVAYRKYGNLAVVWDDGAFQFMRKKAFYDLFYDLLEDINPSGCEVIGNRWDNPELLEEKSDG